MQARKIRTVIVDDEPLARSTVTALLRRDPDIEIVGDCGSGAEAIAAIERAQPDLVFLDVHMPECNGFEVLERLGPRLVFEVVFVTAYDTYAVQAFEAGALDYLLKPFDDDRFAVALRRIKSRMAFHDVPSPHGRLLIKSARQISLVHIEEIDWIEAADYYTCLHIGSKAHLIRRTISQLESELNPSVFCRIHRSSIVNLRRVQTLEVSENGEHDVVLEGGTRLRLSRRYRRRLQGLLRQSTSG